MIWSMWEKSVVGISLFGIAFKFFCKIWLASFLLKFFWDFLISVEGTQNLAFQVSLWKPLGKFESCELPCNFIEITRRQGCSPVNLMHLFRTPFPKNTLGLLLLKFVVVLSWVLQKLDLKHQNNGMNDMWHVLFLLSKLINVLGYAV